MKSIVFNYLIASIVVIIFLISSIFIFLLPAFSPDYFGLLGFFLLNCIIAGGLGFIALVTELFLIKFKKKPFSTTMIFTIISFYNLILSVLWFLLFLTNNIKFGEFESQLYFLLNLLTGFIMNYLILKKKYKN